ncbi:MAG: AzlD domain-containing protein [Ruminiclostridium sp.]|nr:AzlD domain-containing protein [Ruminiclostridium sp.]
MTNLQIILTVLIIMVATMLTRFISFLVFPAGKEAPAFIQYLGKVLPAAAMAMLVVYCYKCVDITAGNHGAPAFLAGLAVVTFQKWKHNMLLSIGGGTALYLILLHWL